MTSLVACLSTGKGSWAQLAKIINSQEWEKIFLITNEFGKSNFSSSKKAELIVIDPMKPTNELVEEIKSALQGKIADFEVAVSICSGTGKEHMAILAGIIKAGLGFRLIDCDEQGLKEL